MRRLEITCRGMEKAPLTMLVLTVLSKHEWITSGDIALYIREYTCYKEDSIRKRIKYCLNHKWIKLRKKKYAITRRGRKHLEKVLYWWIKYIDYVRRLSE